MVTLSDSGLAGGGVSSGLGLGGYDRIMKISIGSK